MLFTINITSTFALISNSIVTLDSIVYKTFGVYAKRKKYIADK